MFHYLYAITTPKGDPVRNTGGGGGGGGGARRSIHVNLLIVTAFRPETRVDIYCAICQRLGDTPPEVPLTDGINAKCQRGQIVTTKRGPASGVGVCVEEPVRSAYA